MLELRGVSKAFGAVQALQNVSMEVRTGEVRALLGSNGAGKSTLIKIIAGVETADSGSMRIEDREITLDSISVASRAGVAAVYQELSLVPGLTVAENILLGRWRRRKGIAGITIDAKAVQVEAQAALDRLGVVLPITALVEDLSVGQQQLVEIAKALSQDPRLLILDEPTSALSSDDADRLIELVRRLGTTGIAIVYVSHRMQEISRVADTLTIMRDGAVVTTIAKQDASVAEVARLMIGEERDSSTGDVGTAPRERVRLAISSLSQRGAFEDVNFAVREGEVLGIAGLLGSGRTELLRCIFGRDRFDSGSVTVDGSDVGVPAERRMIALGVGFTPEDRKRQGVILGLSVMTNLTLAAFGRFFRRGILSSSRERELGSSVSDRLDIKVRNVGDPVHMLSGGNQQKVVIGKWVAAGSEILLFDEPTRGVDVHAKQQVYQIVRTLAQEGCSVVFVSSEFEELFAVCHTIAVMNHGRLADTVPVEETSLQEILALAMKEVTAVG